MGTMYRQEADLPISVQLDDVREAQCGNFTRCTLAKAGKRALGVEIDVGYSYELKKVRVNWKGQDGRRHRGVLTPDTDAMELLFLTDQNKAFLVKKFKRGEVRDLMITEHESRLDYAHNRDKYARNRLVKEQEDQMLLASGQPVPQKKPRKPRVKSKTPPITQRMRVMHSGR